MEEDVECEKPQQKQASEARKMANDNVRNEARKLNRAVNEFTTLMPLFVFT